MNHTATKIKKPYMYLAAMSVMLLLTAAIATPLSAYADHDNGNHKSQDGKKHHKDRKDKDHDKDKCKPKKNGKYNKHCDD